MNSRYSILFTIELLHEYFLNRKCNDFEIIPADDCKAVFRKLNIQYRVIENRLIILIRESADQEPFINNPPGKYYRNDFGKSVFRFYLKLKNPDFLRYTNSNYDTRRKYYFSNLAGNHDNGYLYLTTPVEEFSNGTDYLPGDLARDPQTGNVYETIRQHKSKKKSDLTDPSLWAPKGLLEIAGVTDHTIGKAYLPGDVVRKPNTENVFEATQKHTSISRDQLNDPVFWIDRGKGQLQYPSQSDSLEHSIGTYIFTFHEPVKKAAIEICEFNYKAASPGYDVLVGESESITFDKPTAHVPVSLSNLKPGKYSIKINKETRTVYHDPLMGQGNILGIIEIYNHLPGSDAYSLLTDDEKIKKITYSILFPTRRVLWKYIRKDSKAQAITDTGNTGYEFKLAGDSFISSTPIPLSEGVIKTLKLDFNTADFPMSPLPNPPLNRFGKCTQDEYEYLCSEMYLNY